MQIPTYSCLCMLKLAVNIINNQCFAPESRHFEKSFFCKTKFNFYFRPVCDKSTGKVQQHIQFDSATINEFEYKLQK